MKMWVQSLSPLVTLPMWLGLRHCRLRHCRFKTLLLWEWGRLWHSLLTAEALATNLATKVAS